MKKIVYALYIVAIIAILICTKINVFSTRIGMLVFFVIGIAELFVCLGSSYPTQNQRIETLQTMQDQADRKNEPILLKLSLLLILPLVIGAILMQYL